MMAADGRLYAQFGAGTLSVGCNSVSVPEGVQYYISIRELKNSAPIGTVLPKDIEFLGLNEIILTFSNENQMLNVVAALTNQDADVVCEKWTKSQLEREAH